jgi:hypothetical protein
MGSLMGIIPRWCLDETQTPKVKDKPLSENLVPYLSEKCYNQPDLYIPLISVVTFVLVVLGYTFINNDYKSSNKTVLIVNQFSNVLSLLTLESLSVWVGLRMVWNNVYKYGKQRENKDEKKEDKKNRFLLGNIGEDVHLGQYIPASNFPTYPIPPPPPYFQDVIAILCNKFVSMPFIFWAFISFSKSSFILLFMYFMLINGWIIV